MTFRFLLPILALLPVFTLPAPAPRWGFAAHRLINRSAATHLPSEFQGFTQWASDLERLSTAADERKSTVPGERIKHFIDIDDYPEFLTGQLPHAYTDLVAVYGQSRVDGNGTVPWAIESSYRDLVQHFVSANWDDAVASAADIGHYVGDLHSPLHLTLNFNGQLTGQNGVHSRHESNLTSRHLAELEPAPGTVSTIIDPLEAAFEWIDRQYPGVARILASDLAAKSAAGGSTSSNTYYNALWAEVGGETVTWINDASLAVASLWYAAWVEAGSPALPGSATSRDPGPIPAMMRVLPNAPNPFAQLTRLRFELGDSRGGSVEIFDLSGRRVRRWTIGGLGAGMHELRWRGLDDSGTPLPSGLYQVVATDADGMRAFGQAVLLR
jgi:flagellar hook capping protein FlgD